MARKISVSVGDVYGRLRIVEELQPKQRASGGTSRVFRCVCDCGRETEVPLKNLRAGKTRSCGHHSVPPVPLKLGEIPYDMLMKMRGDRYHGMEGSPEHRVWNGVKQRCYDPKSKGYSNYGGRGIVMCYGWKSSFKAFYEDMGNRPSLAHSIDRIDGNGNYSCGHCDECVANGWSANCRWATPAEQRRNSKDIRLLTFEGETMCLADWAKRKGMCKSALSARLDKMSVEEALRQPVRQWRTDEQFRRVAEASRDSEWRRDAVRRGLSI